MDYGMDLSHDVLIFHVFDEETKPNDNTKSKGIFFCGIRKCWVVVALGGVSAMAPGRWRWAAYLLVLFCRLYLSSAGAQPGKWTVVYSKFNNSYTFYKTMFNNTDVILGVPERQCVQNETFLVKWVLIYAHCYNTINNIEENINQGRYDSGSLKKLPLVEHAEDSFRPTCDNFSFRVRAYESKSET
uniref:TMEM87A/B GOLD domain-containing protein n=1 Tax=Eptatretus burgeri TaxID=7764 RepID=A0A8C4Q7S8_EPTBU